MITRYVPFVLTLDAPLVLASLDSDPNSAASLTFIPGSALRGAAARSLCARGVDRFRPVEFRRFILTGDVRYLNAYLAVGGRRGLPVPVSLRREKHSSGLFDLSAGTEPPDGQLSALARSLEYVTADMDVLMGGNPAMMSRTHQQRDRSVGRPTITTGSIFRFEALDAGQEFHGLLAVTAEDEVAVSHDTGLIQDVLGTTLLLGRSRRAGYGGAARVTWGSLRERESDGVRVVAGDQPAGTLLRVLLTSDYLGRHPLTGQIDPAACAVELRQRLGDRIEIVQRFQEFRAVGGYNRTWGLELPQGMALRAGSVLVVRLTQAVPWADLLAVEQSGLGERRTEGFGQVVFLKPVDGNVTLQQSTPVVLQRPEGTPPPLLQTLQRRLLEDAAEERIAETAARLAATATELPSRSLLGQLRIPLRRPPREALGEFRGWIEALRPHARRQLEACRLGETDRSLRVWLLETSDSERDLANLLGYDELARQYYFATVEAARTTLDNLGFANRTRLRLIEAVLAALARKQAG
jgi:CRISPR-associated protein Csx10